MTGDPVGAASRELLALALDTDDLAAALALARRLRPYFGVAKVGLELFAASGPRALGACAEEGFAVFADLKLHDIPTTVARAARAVGALGATYLTVHTVGGAAMLSAAVEGFAAGRAAGNVGAPRRRAGVLGVTVLTSEDAVDPGELGRRARLAAAAGCVGVVCAAADLGVVAPAARGLLRVVPGIRSTGAPRHDQARVATPREALAAGAGLLVIGRTVTAASDPEAASVALVAELAAQGAQA